MKLQINDWEFDIDAEKTGEHSSFASREHCTCDYCENYYRTAGETYPGLKRLLGRFFLKLEGPSEMYPFEPTICLVGYRVMGKILRYGAEPIWADDVPVLPVPREGGCFFLEAGEMELPWVMETDPNEVISPANEPEFLEKMYRKLWERTAPGSPIPS